MDGAEGVTDKWGNTGQFRARGGSFGARGGFKMGNSTADSTNVQSMSTKEVALWGKRSVENVAMSDNKHSSVIQHKFDEYFRQYRKYQEGDWK